MSVPTYDEWFDLVAGLRVELEQLRAENAALRARVADLQAQLRVSPRNSSKPPSSEGPAKPAPKSLRDKSGRKPGGQVGHRGETLTQVTDPDVVIRHEPVCCRGCGSGLGGGEQVGVVRRQVFDLPPVKVHVTEHQIISRRCRCGVTTAGQGPDQVNAPAQYGPIMRAVIVYLYMGQFLSKQRTAHALSELFAVPVSAGTVAAACGRAAGDLTEFLDQVTGRLHTAGVVHFDETGLRCQGRTHWLHSASTPQWSRIFYHRRRGVEAMTAMGVLPGFTGTAVHDAWAPYDRFTTAGHVLCNAHLLRELQAVIDDHAEAAPGQWCWADQITRALLTLHKTVTENPDRTAPAAVITEQTMKIRHALLQATHPDGARGRKHRALARRISRRETAYLAFASHPDVPFTNNPAEQEIRMTKIRQKISGTMRTPKGAQQFADIRSYIQTTAKHGIRTLDALTRLTSQDPWLPNQT